MRIFLMTAVAVMALIIADSVIFDAYYTHAVRTLLRQFMVHFGL